MCIIVVMFTMNGASGASASSGGLAHLLMKDVQFDSSPKGVRYQRSDSGSHTSKNHPSRLSLTSCLVLWWSQGEHVCGCPGGVRPTPGGGGTGSVAFSMTLGGTVADFGPAEQSNLRQKLSQVQDACACTFMLPWT